MNIQAIKSYSPKVNFSSNGEKPQYENPVNRKTEKGLTIWGSIGTGALVGATAGGIATCFIKETAKHRYAKAGFIGLAVMAATMALTLPAKLYKTKVNAFTREKEMDVYSRDKELKSNLLTEVDKEVKNEDVPLEEKINHYATMQMASNGSGLLIKGV